MPVRTLRFLLLAATLLFTQLGGVLHGLSHQVQDQDRPHTPCQLCAAYAALDHAAVGQAAPPPTTQTFAPPAPAADAGRFSLTPPSYRARAPPILA